MGQGAESHVYCITENIHVQENFANFARFAKLSCPRIFAAHSRGHDGLLYPKIRLWSKFAKFSCHEIFLLYSIMQTELITAVTSKYNFHVQDSEKLATGHAHAMASQSLHIVKRK